MHLIDDIDPVRAFRRRILDLFPDLTDILHTVVGCRVDLYYIHGASGCDCLAGCAFIARTSVHWMLTVYCLCKNLCNGSFAGSPCSAKQISMADTPAGNLVF